MNERILFIDAAVREQSRTRRLAKHLLSKLDGEIETLSLPRTKIPELDAQTLEKRSYLSAREQFDDELFDCAKQFLQADIIVISAPFWDNSFPAVLKKYIEAITVNNLTFRYTPEGIPQGLCRAKKLYYVTTAGGAIYNDAFGYGYIKEMATGMYGIKETQMFSAQGLDIVGADEEKIMRNAEREIDACL